MHLKNHNRSYFNNVWFDWFDLLKIIKQLSDHSPLQQDLHTWTINSDLLFSIKKCIQLSFNMKMPTLYSIDSTVLPQLNTHRDLGWFLSLERITMFTSPSSKAYKYLGLLRRVFSCCSSVSAKKNTLHYSR